MIKFCKNENCPASEDLLAFQTGDMPLADGTAIRKHLKTCEFCAAEVEFYEDYPPTLEPEEPKAEAMPRPLYELAEALLTKKADDDFFDRLLEEGEDHPITRR